MKALFSPFSELLRGLRSYGQGVSWLRANKRYFLLLFLPMVVGFLLLGYGWDVFMGYQDSIFQTILFAKPENDWLLPVYYLCKMLLYVAFFGVGLVTCMLLVNILACPIYEWVSVAVERDLSNGQVEEISLWASLRLIGEEIKKVLFILLISILLLFIPGLNVLSTFITAFLFGWNFYDYPQARRGWSFKRRLSYVMGDFWAVMGLGLWLMIPFVQVLLVPMAVVGGTILSLNSMKQQRLSV